MPDIGEVGNNTDYIKDILEIYDTSKDEEKNNFEPYFGSDSVYSLIYESITEYQD